MLPGDDRQRADGRPFAADLARATGLDVTLVAESRGLSLAERLFGDARDLTDYLVVDLSDGLTMGLVCGGRSVSGRNGLAGGFGHMALGPGGAVCGCGSRGCLETPAGDLALAEGVGQALGRPMTVEQAVEAVRSGVPEARQAFEENLEWLSVGMAALINGLNPQAVFLHGALLDAADDTLARLTVGVVRRALAAGMKDCVLRRSRAFREQAAVGAAIERLVSQRGPTLK
jgi:predicted NBD/HSP70 family sugar kinase